MARTANPNSAVRSLEKVLKQLKEQGVSLDATPPVRGKKAQENAKKAEQLIKESRRFGEALMAAQQKENIKIQIFLNTISTIETGSYESKRGGKREGVGRKKKSEGKQEVTAAEAIAADRIND